MIRQIIKIDEEKCNGCGLCANACHEGAIAIVEGKARLIKDDYCDGMGDCLPACPQGALSFEEREAAAYDEKAVEAHLAAGKDEPAAPVFKIEESVPESCTGPVVMSMDPYESQLRNWPVQIKLAPVTAPYYNGADLLVAADCTAFAYAAFHRDFISGKVTLAGCPKLDDVDYSVKLTEIIRNDDIKSVTVVRMQVPCCGGLEMAVKNALLASGRSLPWQVTVISMDGKILDQQR